MISVCVDQIPSFLINSNLYKQFYQELSNDEEISINESHFVNKIKLDNIEDFSRILDVLRYWMVNEVPNEIFKFIEENPELDYDSVFEKFDDFPFIGQLKLLLDFSCKNELEDVRRAKNSFLAIYKHKTEFVKLFMNISGPYVNAYTQQIFQSLENSELDVIENKLKFINLIAKNDYIDLLKYLSEEENYDFSGDFLDICVIENSPNCINYMKEIALPQRLAFVAAAFGNLPILKLLHQNGCRISDLTAIAACFGDIECYKYISEQTKKKINYVTTQEQIKTVTVEYSERPNTSKRSIFQSFGVFAQLIQTYRTVWPNVLPGFVMPTFDFHTQDIKNIEKQTITFLDEIGKHLNLKSLLTTVATISNNIDLLKELCNDGYKIAKASLGIAIKNENIEIVKFSLENMKKQNINQDKFRTGFTTQCGHNGNLEILKLLHQYQYQLEPLCLENAAYKGHYDIIKYCCENNCQLTSKIINNAAIQGRIDIFKYLLDNNCPNDAAVYIDIVEFGVEKHIYSGHKFPYKEKITCSEEEKKEKRLTMLKLVHQKELSSGNISWSEAAPMNACKNGDLDIFKYLSENGCNYNVKNCLVASIGSGVFDLVKHVYQLYKTAKQSNSLPSDQAPLMNQPGAILMSGMLIFNPKTQYCDAACKNRNLEILKFLREKGFEWDNQAYNKVLTGRIYELDRQSSNHKRTSELEMVKYLHENECEWDSVVLGTAAVNGHLDCLKYIHKNGGELPKNTFFSSQMVSSCVDSYTSHAFDIINVEKNVEKNVESLKRNHFECLKYLCEMGLKLDQMCLLQANRTKNQELIDYVKHHYVEVPKPKKRSLMDMFTGLFDHDNDDLSSEYENEPQM